MSRYKNVKCKHFVEGSSKCCGIQIHEAAEKFSNTQKTKVMVF